MYYASKDQFLYDLNKLLVFLSVIDKFKNGKNHPMVSQERIDHLLDGLKNITASARIKLCIKLLSNQKYTEQR